MPPAYAWQPLVLPALAPVPLRRPQSSVLREPLLLSAEEARFLALGLGRVDMDLKWCWHWSDVGTLHAFRSWTGLEIFRLEVRLTAPFPDASWQVVTVQYDMERLSTDDVEGLFRQTMQSLLGHATWLADVPGSRVEALARVRSVPPAPPYPPEALVASLSPRLPCSASRLTIGDYEVPLSDELMLMDVAVDGTAAVMTFSDRSQLWLYDSRPSVDPIGLESIAGGVLLWPGPESPLAHQVAMWSAVTDSERRTEHTLRDFAGEPVDVSKFSPAGNVGLANVVLDLPGA